MREAFAKLIKCLKKSYKIEDLEVVRHAYRVANEAHKNQLRASGEPYIFHSIEVATILASLGLDPVTCAAALLHDVVEDTSQNIPGIRKEFGDDIARIVTASPRWRLVSDDARTERTSRRRTSARCWWRPHGIWASS